MVVYVRRQAMRKYCCIVVLLGLCSLLSFGMENVGSQLEFCPTRKAYIQQVLANKKAVMPKCFFCDKDSLNNNYILDENAEKDVRVMMNKAPYPDFDQAIHLLFMPIVHKELPHDFSMQELISQVDAVHTISQKLDYKAYSQEWFTNWGRLGGQTVAHWHSQLKVFIQPPCSMPERMKRVKNFSITTIEGASEKTKELLKACPDSLPNLLHDIKVMHSHKECLCCMIRNGQENNADNNDKDNFVVARFLHNYICLSHYPSYAGEVCVVPHRHVAAIKDLSQDELRENMILAMALFPKMQEYAQNNIRQCDGGNLYTKSMGSKASKDQQEAYHVCTVIMPRTTISPTPGTKNRNSCKLDYDPNHLLAYLKETIKNINV